MTAKPIRALELHYPMISFNKTAISALCIAPLILNMAAQDAKKKQQQQKDVTVGES